jgi:hypothetical protein
MGIPCDSGITTFIIIVSSRTHLVMIRFRSAIPKLSETGIGRKRWESVGIPRNSVRFRNYNFHYYCIISYPSSDEGEGEGEGVRVRGEDSTCDIVQFRNRPESAGIPGNSFQCRLDSIRGIP